MELLVSLVVLMPIAYAQIIFPGELISLSSTLSPTTATDATTSPPGEPPVQEIAATPAPGSLPSSSLDIFSTQSVLVRPGPEPIMPTRTTGPSIANPFPIVASSDVPLPISPPLSQSNSLTGTLLEGNATLPATKGVTPTPVLVTQVIVSTFPISRDPAPSGAGVEAPPGTGGEPSAGTTEGSSVSAADTSTTSSEPHPPSSSADTSTSEPDSPSSSAGTSTSEPDLPSSSVDTSSSEPDSPSSSADTSTSEPNSPSSSADTSTSESDSPSSSAGTSTSSAVPITPSTTTPSVSSHPAIPNHMAALPVTPRVSSTDSSGENIEVHDQMVIDTITNDAERPNDDDNEETGGAPCITPLGEEGTCVALRDCSGYASLMTGVNDSNLADFLRTIVCRIRPRSVLFCCPAGSPILPTDS